MTRSLSAQADNFLALAEEYKASGDERQLQQLTVRYMGHTLPASEFWFDIGTERIAEILALASRYPESITAFFATLSAKKHYPRSFSASLQWLALWDLLEKQPEPTVQMLLALSRFRPGKRLVDPPPDEWWTRWEESIASLPAIQARDVCEQLWIIPTLSDSYDGYAYRGIVEYIGRATPWGIAAIADQRTIDILVSIPNTIKMPTFIPAMAILSLGQIHRLGRVEGANIPARLAYLSKVTKSKPSLQVISATLARINSE